MIARVITMQGPRASQAHPLDALRLLRDTGPPG
jgi:hypothetical protein